MSFFSFGACSSHHFSQNGIRESPILEKCIVETEKNGNETKSLVFSITSDLPTRKIN